jgi:hypothetical protein
MCGKCYRWAFDFMVNFLWNNRDADPGQYKMCVGILRDPKSGLRNDHAWIEDITKGEILHKFEARRKIDHASRKDFYRLMKPQYVKKYSGREMLKKALKAGMPGLLPNVPKEVLEASDVRLHWMAN